MKVLAMVYPGMTLLDLVGPVQAWSFLPGYEVQYAWHRTGPVPTDCGLSVQATHTFRRCLDRSRRPHGRRRREAHAGSAGRFRRHRVSRRSRLARPLGLQRLHRLAAAGRRRAAARLPRRRALGRARRVEPVRRRAQRRARLRRSQSPHRCRASRRASTSASPWPGTGPATSTGRLIELIMEYAPKPPYGTGPSRPRGRADARDCARGDAAGDDGRSGVEAQLPRATLGADSWFITPVVVIAERCASR